MSYQLQEDQEKNLFFKDLNSGWNSDSVQCPWPNTTEHLNELYDIHGVGGVKNVLCLRLFASSLFEIANGSKDARKLKATIFGERLIRKIADFDIQISESIEQTVQYLAWKIRKSQILAFRRTSENHSWRSVREILIKILSNGDDDHEQIVTGVSATILHDIFRCHVTNNSFHEDASLLPKNRFQDVFRVAFLLFNDSIGEYIQKKKAEVVYEMLASRLVYFYTRLAADTWRILVLRNGPKVETEWYMLRGVEDHDSDSRYHNSKSSSSNYTNNNNFTYNQKPPQSHTVNQYSNQRPLRKL